MSLSLKRSTDARILPLEAVQVVDMVEYLSNIRAKIITGKYLSIPGRRPSSKKRFRRTQRLILSLKGSHDIKNTLHHLFLDLQKNNPKVKSARQLRQSIIAHWLSKYDLRHVQYMAGHRYVGSTERYKVTKLEELKREIDTYHPLKAKYALKEY